MCNRRLVTGSWTSWKVKDWEIKKGGWRKKIKGNIRVIETNEIVELREAKQNLIRIIIEIKKRIKK